MTSDHRPPETTDILVVGAGAAGLSAAALASRSGVQVTILDENARPGGQYYRQSRLLGDLPPAIVGPSQAAGRALIGEIDPAHGRICCDVAVWGADGPKTLLYTQQGRTGRITAKAIILATGAHERVVPFPGWTLPGVMTAGAAQTLLKSQAILPGSSIVIAGTGPFLYPVATQLAAAGAQIKAIYEISHSRFWPLRAPQPQRHLSLYREAMGYLLQMRRLGLSVNFGHTVVEGHGDASLREVTIAQMDKDMVERPGTRRRVRADTLLTSFGFLPNLQIARLLGCDLRWDETQQGHFASCDERGQSSIPGIYVAGEIAGIGGHRVARAEGMLAAYSAIEDLGASDLGWAKGARRAARRSQRANRRFSDHMLKTFALKPQLFDIATRDTLICRCESVAREEIDHFARLWGGSPRAVKQCTRAGMGRCQGRICAHAIGRIARRHVPDADFSPAADTARMPVKPLALSDFIADEHG